MADLVLQTGGSRRFILLQHSTGVLTWKPPPGSLRQPSQLGQFKSTHSVSSSRPEGAPQLLCAVPQTQQCRHLCASKLLQCCVGLCRCYCSLSARRPCSALPMPPRQSTRRASPCMHCADRICNLLCTNCHFLPFIHAHTLPGVRLLRFEAEVSRERVPLRNAYKAAGQKAVVRINGGLTYTLPVSSRGWCGGRLGCIGLTLRCWQTVDVIASAAPRIVACGWPAYILCRMLHGCCTFVQ